MAEITLHGALSTLAPAPLRLAVRTPAEAVRALAANFPEFEGLLRAGVWHVVRGQPDGGMYLGVDELAIGLGSDTPLHVIPAVHGAGRGGGKAIIGAVIMVVAVAVAIINPPAGASMMGLMSSTGGLTIYGSVAMVGASMMVSGIAQMLAPTPKMQSFEEADKARSYLFSGPQNRVEQGNVVPVIYGLCRVGSVCVSASISVDDVASSSTSGDAAAPLITPDHAAASPTGGPLDFLVSSGLADCVGYTLTGLSGGALSIVTATGETDFQADGNSTVANAFTVRYRPAENFAGGGFALQAINGSGTPIGASRSVSVSATPLPSDSNGDGGGGGDGGGNE